MKKVCSVLGLTILHKKDELNEFEHLLSFDEFMQFENRFLNVRATKILESFLFVLPQLSAYYLHSQTHVKFFYIAIYYVMARAL